MATSGQHPLLSVISQSVTLPNGIHAYTGGSGSFVILLSGWPQTADAYSEIFSALSEKHQVWALDPPGLGDSAPSTTGYDTTNISLILKEAIHSQVSKPYHLVGHDVGAWIAYAWAAQFPDFIKSLTMLDSAVPGKGPPLSFPLADDTNVKMWQFSFNRLPDLPEALTKGRERVVIDWLLDHKAKHPERITEVKRARYTECYARPGAMSQGFAYYRAVIVSAGQNIKYSEERLRMPILALGGSIAVGKGMKMAMETLASNVVGGEIEDCGHFVMEEQPEVVSKKLLDFFEVVDRSALSFPNVRISKGRSW